MKKVDLFFLLISCFLSWTALPAQTTDHVLGDLLVQLRPGTDAHRWAREWEQFAGRPTHFRIQDQLSPPLNIWHFHFDHGSTHELRLLSAIRRHKAVVAAQFNHFVGSRETIPSDPLFNRQWQYINKGENNGLANADLDMELAWDITTGGLTADGDTIVVCIIDDGTNLEHEDLIDNIWINRAEIPDNGIDDDLNGYVDDYRGWNVLQDNDNVEVGGNHGTSVSGIVGAVGNNDIGVSGVNWQVKLMIVKNNFNTTEATVIEAYSYPLIQRMRYNETNGSEGAFVVATNASWGRDRAFAEDAPIWCGLYDSLGVHGILSAGATTNEDIDVDLEGDLPTTCPSEFLLSVTNVDRSDQKVKKAGYGLQSIDLGAYGQEAYTTSRSDYGIFNGTSSATPHVTGAIALLYAAPCPALMAIAKSDPAGAALLVRNYILEGVTSNTSLDGITVSGGRLNINQSLQALMANCQDCQPPTSIRPQNITDTEASISWISNDSITRVDLRYRLLGTTSWLEFPNVASPQPLTNLLACTDYEFQIKTYCGNDEREYTGSRTFKTDGCCEAPELIQVRNITQTSAVITWPAVLAADQYILRWRESGREAWQEVTTALETVPLSGLTGCTNYDYQLLLNCSGERTDASPVYTFNTNGCGVCRESEYCNPGSYDASGEWIARVKFSTLDNRSGADKGYGQFTELEPPLVEQSGGYDILLKPGYSDQSFSEYFMVWIDYNQDGVFTSAELAYDAGQVTKDSIIGRIEIPADAKLGSTRMRVAMRFQQSTTPCAQFGSGIFGEVEDYCLEVIAATNCALPSAFNTVSVNDNEVQLQWRAAPEVAMYNVRYRALNSVNWNSFEVSDTSIVISGLEQCTNFEAQVQSDCGATQSVYIGNLLFSTTCVNAVQEPQILSRYQVYPNPVQEQLNIGWEFHEKPGDELQLHLMSPDGKLLHRQEVIAGFGPQQTTIATGDLPPGLYFVRLLNGRQVLATEKVIKVR